MYERRTILTNYIAYFHKNNSGGNINLFDPSRDTDWCHMAGCMWAGGKVSVLLQMHILSTELRRKKIVAFFFTRVIRDRHHQTWQKRKKKHKLLRTFERFLIPKQTEL